MRLEIEYPFLATASVNHAYNRGCMSRGMKPEVKVWKEGLTLLVKNKLQHLPEDFKPPVSLRFILFSPKRSGAIDAGNYAKIIEDAVFSALPFDDNDLNLIRGPYAGVRAVKDMEPHFAMVLEEIGDFRQCFSLDDLVYFKLMSHEDISRILQAEHHRNIRKRRR